jgi:hypothetical protein
MRESSPASRTRERRALAAGLLLAAACAAPRSQPELPPPDPRRIAADVGVVLAPPSGPHLSLLQQATLATDLAELKRRRALLSDAITDIAEVKRAQRIPAFDALAGMPATLSLVQPPHDASPESSDEPVPPAEATSPSRASAPCAPLDARPALAQPMVPPRTPTRAAHDRIASEEREVDAYLAELATIVGSPPPSVRLAAFLRCLGESEGLTVISLDVDQPLPASRPGVRSLPISIVVEGEREALAKWALRMSQVPRIMTFESCTLEPASNRPLHATATLSMAVR